MKTRVVLTALLVLGIMAFNFVANTAAPLISGPLSVKQLDNSDVGYVESRAGTLFNGSGIPAMLGLLALVLIWWKPVATKLKAGMLAIVVMLCVVSSSYANVTDKDEEEWKTIKPNQTAYLVPMTGANKTTQGAFDSEAYLESLKLAAKRIQIPHVLLPKVGLMNWNKYIPSSMLFIVTREPYARSWQKEASKGTSSKDEGFYVESSESINIDFGVLIAAEIEQKNASKYLFHFGVSDKLDQGDSPEFPSVSYAKDLSTVMDTIVYNDVHRILAREYGRRSLEKCLTDKSEIMDIANKEIIPIYAEMGITIRYVGYASQLNLDPKIQEAVNNVAIARLDASAVENRMKTLPVLKGLAEIELIKAASKAVEKWSGNFPALPSFMVLPAGFENALSNWLNPSQLKGAIPAPSHAEK